MRRRKVLKAIAGAGAGLLSAASARRVQGANDRIRVGFIGIGLIGKRHLLDFMAQPDVEVAAIAEVSRRRGSTTAWPARGGSPRALQGLPQAPRPQGRGRGGRVHSRPLARAHDHARLRGGQGRVRREAAHPRGARGRVDAAGRARATAGWSRSGTQQRSGEQYKKMRRAAPRRPHRRRPQRAHRLRPQHLSPASPGPLRPSPSPPPTGTCGSGPHPSCPAIRTAASTISAGSGTTRVARPRTCSRTTSTSPSGRSRKHPTGWPPWAHATRLTGMGDTPDLVEALLEYPGFMVNWSSHEAAAGLDGRPRLPRHEGPA